MNNILVCFSDEKEEYYVLCESAGHRTAIDVESICMIIDSNHDLKRAANMAMVVCVLFNMIGIEYDMVDRGRANEIMTTSTTMIDTQYIHTQEHYNIDIYCPEHVQELLSDLQGNMKNRTKINFR